ncbi:30S ribosome-binding factor RbfA [Ammonifex thiophilus]|uniref:Ribosome-binding factor A n=1 Tax=Ammonifex thiophilus TaxID=444093 RepID=A0A3D8P2L2_9THEO|nr:30S ribosome-binding factor RbfA [Ammonifex thiophilus]RDV82518.1 30S ribosome-binding factor RbfA [Ammonifex thiophilus]
MSYRSARLAEAIKEVVADVLQHELKDPRLGFVTVTRVEVSADLRHAKIFLSVYGSQEEEKESFEVLEKAKGFIRSALGKRLRLRHVPEIVLKPDPSISYGVRVMELLSEIKKEGTGPDGES